MFDKNTPYPSLYSLFPTIGTGLIILFARPDTLVGRFLACKAFVDIGLISYSAYLWHQPLLAFARSFNGGTALPWTLSVTLISMTLSLAYVSWKFVEIPFRAKGPMSRRVVWIFAGCCSASFAAAGIFGQLSGGYSGRFDEAILQIIASASWPVDMNKDVECSKAYLQPKSMEEADYCYLKRSKSGGVRVALLGDSHANQFIPAIYESRLGQEGFIYIGAGGCPPFRGLGLKHSYGRGVSFCPNVSSIAYAAIETENPEIVVISSRLALTIEGKDFFGWEHHLESINFPNQSFQESIESQIVQDLKELLDSNLRRIVVIVHQVPELEFEPRDCLLSLTPYGFVSNANQRNITVDKCVMRKTDVQLRQSNYRNILQSVETKVNSSRLVFIDPMEILCDDYNCQSMNNGIPLYRDNNHLSLAASKLVWTKVESLAIAATKLPPR